MEGFYGIEVSVGKQVKPSIPEGCILRISQIALPAGAAEPITLRVGLQGKFFVIATLDPRKALFHMSTDIVFSAAQGIVLAADGSGSMHLTGVIQANDSDDMEMFDEDDDDLDLEGLDDAGDEEEMPAPRQAKSSKKGKK